MVKLHKWKYQDSKKVFLRPKKMTKILQKKSAVIYDTRHSAKFFDFHFKGAINVSPLNIKQVILRSNVKTRIVLVHDFHRTNATVASWARYNGYRKIYLFCLTSDFEHKNLLTINPKN